MPHKFRNKPIINSGYITFDKNNMTALAKNYTGPKKFDAIQKAAASTDPIRTRPAYYKENYLSERPNEILPISFRDVIHACRSSYLRMGIIRNVIDLMTDFACEDLQIVHPDKKVEAFFKVWMTKVNFPEAISEFVRHFLIDGNVVVKRTLAKLSRPVEEQWVERTLAQDDPEKLYTENQPNKREIPWRYNFLNVAALYWLGGDVARMNGERQLAFRPGQQLINELKSPGDAFQQVFRDKIPDNARNALLDKFNKNKGLVPLDMDALYVAHNKKDSWEDWAPPFLYCVLSDIAYKDKLRQAEISAMDGWMNCIRLWKIGDHKEGFLPAEGAIDKLITILDTNTGGGTIDIVWDSLIDMKDYYPPVEKILGSDKFKEVDRDILIALGIPEVLIGGAGANFSNSWIQLKTLVEKLKYVRGIVSDWVHRELNLVCQAMDIAIAPKARFNQINLEDENVARKLIVGLFDRGIISAEAVLNIYGEDFLIEIERIKRETKVFNQSNIDVKGPFDTQPSGTTPTQPPGRPSQTQDVNRKTRNPKVRRAAASLITYAFKCIELIDENIIPPYTQSLGISDGRNLTKNHRREIDKIRQLVLANMKFEDNLSPDLIMEAALNTINVNLDVFKYIQNKVNSCQGELTLENKKMLEATAWAEFYTNQDGDE
jgi:hypothetical protein